MCKSGDGQRIALPSCCVAEEINAKAGMRDAGHLTKSQAVLIGHQQHAWKMPFVRAGAAEVLPQELLALASNVTRSRYRVLVQV